MFTEKVIENTNLEWPADHLPGWKQRWPRGFPTRPPASSSWTPGSRWSPTTRCRSSGTGHPHWRSAEHFVGSLNWLNFDIPSTYLTSINENYFHVGASVFLIFYDCKNTKSKSHYFENAIKCVLFNYFFCSVDTDKKVSIGFKRCKLVSTDRFEFQNPDDVGWTIFFRRILRCVG